MHLGVVSETDTWCFVALILCMQGINSVHAREAPMTRRWVPGLSGDSGYRGSSIASTDSGRGSSIACTDSGYRGSSTAATSTHSTSHLVEHYQKMSMHPLAEGRLRYART